MADSVPVMFEGNDVRLIPQDQVQSAVQNGGKVAQKMLFNGNDARWIPAEEVENARKSGGTVMGTSPQPAPQPEMQTQSLFQDQDKDVIPGVVRAAKAVAGMPGAVYHAVTDMPRNQEEEQLADTNGRTSLLNPFGHEGGTVVSRAALAGKRLLINPNQNAFDRGEQLQQRADAEQDPHKKAVLTDAAGMWKQASTVPLVGAPAAQLAERAGYGNLDDPNNKMKLFGDDADPWGSLAEGLTYALTPKIAKESSRLAASVARQVPGVAGDIAAAGAKRAGAAAVDAGAGLAKTAGRVALRTGANVMQGAASEAGDMVSDSVGRMSDALKEHVNGLKSDLSDQIQEIIRRPSGNGMHADIQDLIEHSSNGVQHVMDNAGQIASDILDKIKANAQTAGQVTSDLVDKVANRVVDEYYLRKNPSVSGGSQGADFDPTTEPAPTFRGTVNANSPQAVGPSPTTGGVTTPVVNDQVGVGPLKQPLRTPLATLADQEDWAKPLNAALTRGQKQGGIWQKLETSVRRSPVLGRMFQEGDDVTLKNRVTQMLRDASQDATLGNNARAILKGSAKDIDTIGRFNLAKTIQKIDDGLNSPGTFKIFGNPPGRLIGDATPRMELLRDALSQTQKDIEASTRFGAMAPTTTAMGTAIKIAQHLGVKWMVRHLFTPGEMDEASPLIRMLSNVPRVPEEGDALAARVNKSAKEAGTDYTNTDMYKNLTPNERRLVDRKAESVVNRFKRVWRGVSLPGQPPRAVQPGQMPLPASHPEWNIASAHPGTHAFSFQQYLQNNPNASPDDARQAGRDAENAGYEVSA